MSDSKEKTTHFGYQQVPESEKAAKVGAVFDSVADKYDIMNDLMSMGVHRLWKRYAIELSGVKRGGQVLDIAGGTGDLAAKMSTIVGDRGLVTLADINAQMLIHGRDKLIDKGLVNNLVYTQADAECLPFVDHSFDCVTMAFGLRNVTHKEKALSSIYRVLKAGGKCLILEFSHPENTLLKYAYDAYSFNVLPKLGKWVVDDASSYEYLAESIRMHPDQETLKQMMVDAGFEKCDYMNMTGGVVAMHWGYKI